MIEQPHGTPEERDANDTRGESNPTANQARQIVESEGDKVNPGKTRGDARGKRRQRTPKTSRWRHFRFLWEFILPGVYGVFTLILILQQTRTYNRQTKIFQQQLLEMRHSNDAASAAANAAKDSVKNAVEISRLDQRAWVTVKEIKLDKPLTTDAKPLIVVEFQNTGKTPALEVHAAAKVFSRNFLTDSDLAENVLPTSDPKSRTIIGPSETKYVRAEKLDMLTTKEINELGDCAVMRLYVFGVLNYKDVFGQDHKTSFCYFTCGGGTQGWDMAGADRGNKAD